MKKLTDIVSRVVATYPTDTGAAVDGIVEAIQNETVATQAEMNQALVVEGIKAMIAQARNASKLETKARPIFTTNGAGNAVPVPPRQSRRVDATTAVGETILDTWPIGRGTNRKSLGAATAEDLQREIDFGEAQREGIDTNNTFYRRLSERLSGISTVRAAWKVEEVETLKDELWEPPGAAA